MFRCLRCTVSHLAIALFAVLLIRLMNSSATSPMLIHPRTRFAILSRPWSIHSWVAYSLPSGRKWSRQGARLRTEYALLSTQAVVVNLCFDNGLTRAMGSELHVCELQLLLDRLYWCQVAIHQPITHALAASIFAQSCV